MSQDSYLYCYYRDYQGSIARIFPNRFQPDPYIVAGRTVEIPAKDSGFDIVFETAGVEEEILCLASYREVGLSLPARYKAADLTPLPVSSMAELIAAFAAIESNDLAQARLPIRVAE